MGTPLAFEATDFFFLFFFFVKQNTQGEMEKSYWLVDLV
jgi:hypothetical protein